MIKITITTIKVDANLIKQCADLVEGETAYYIIRESGKRLSIYYGSESDAIQCAWSLVKQFGLTLVEPW